MDTDEPITYWISQLKEGDQIAAKQLWEQYFSRVCRFADKRLRQTSGRVSDEEDVALSALHALCKGAREGRFRKLENRDDLWQLLVVITSRKATDQFRKTTRRKEVGESAMGIGVDLVANATPESVDTLASTCAELLPRLEGKLLEVAMLKLEGYTNEEIAERRNRSVKTVERYLKMIRAEWNESQEEGHRPS